jgi:hypothetical protein
VTGKEQLSICHRAHFEKVIAIAGDGTIIAKKT